MTDRDWPFDAWLRLAVIRFGLSPNQFWTMSLTDWLTLVSPENGGGISRKNMAELMAKYPDQKEGNGRDR